MTTPPDHILANLAAIIAQGAAFYHYNGDDTMPLKAATWIPGKGLLIAEAGAIDQSGVHLIPADIIDEDGDQIDLYNAADDLIGLIQRDERNPAPVFPDSWAAFWADEIQNAKGGE